jgi:hypothetical protein
VGENLAAGTVVSELGYDLYGLLLNVQCDHIPQEISLPTGARALLTSAYEIPFEAQFYVAGEDLMELTEWREHAKALALVAHTSCQTAGTPDFEGSRRSMRQIVSAIRILKARWAGMPLEWATPTGAEPAVQSEVWVSKWDIAQRYVWDGDTPCLLGRREIATVAQIAGQLEDMATIADHERRRINIAISRLDRALDRADLEDEVIDLTIALEGLYGNGGKDDIGATLARRACLYLNESFRPGEQFAEMVVGWYGVRNYIVHGRSPGEQLDGASSGLRQLVRKTLRKALAEPTSLSDIRRL